MGPMVVTLALGTYFADGFAKQGISIAGRFWPYGVAAAAAAAAGVAAARRHNR